MFSVSEDYYSAATEELLRAFPSAVVERIGPDAGRITLPADISVLAAVCRQRPVVFVRHLMRERFRVPVADAKNSPGFIAGEIASAVEHDEIDGDVALQVWMSGVVPRALRTDELWHAVAHDLSGRGIGVSRAHQEQIASVCITPRTVHVGLNRREDALVDWPGGRVSLAKSPDQVSRSEFKLEELLKVFEFRLPAGGRALDLGASPGGWTRILRRAGLSVWPVDPAALDQRVRNDPDVHPIRSTAGPFLASNLVQFEVIVNDMRMEPDRSCETMLAAARHLRRGGLAIVTLKLLGHEPLREIEKAIQTLDRAYAVLHARQLFHNRHEVTVVARRR